MRVMLINSVYDPYFYGGAERSVTELAGLLQAKGHEVHVFTMRSGIRDDGPTIHSYYPRVWPYGESWNQKSAARKALWHASEIRRVAPQRMLARLIEEFSPDVVHSNVISGFSTNIWSAVPSTTALVHSLRDYYLLCFKSNMLRRDQTCVSRCGTCVVSATFRAAAPRRIPDRFVAVSRRVADLHASCLPKRMRQIPVEIIHNAPNLTRAAYPRRAGPIRSFGFLGRIEPAKGVEQLVVAFRALPERSAELFIAGYADKARIQWLNSLIDGDPRISFVGPVDPTEYLNQCDALVVPAQWEEPYGRTAAEAASHGVPVLISDVGGLPEAVRGFASASLVSDFKNPQAWTLALQQMLASEGGRAAPTFKREPAEMAEQYVSAYKSARQSI